MQPKNRANTHFVWCSASSIDISNSLVQVSVKSVLVPHLLSSGDYWRKCTRVWWHCNFSWQGFLFSQTSSHRHNRGRVSFVYADANPTCQDFKLFRKTRKIVSKPPYFEVKTVRLFFQIQLLLSSLLAQQCCCFNHGSWLSSPPLCYFLRGLECWSPAF